MDIIAALEQRRSIRAYTKRPVEKEVLDRLLALAVKAPTGSGLEPWGFVILQRREEIDELSERIKAKVLEHIDRYPEFSQYEDWDRHLRRRPFSVVCLRLHACRRQHHAGSRKRRTRLLLDRLCQSSA